ncbi:hypothetical protein LJR245_007552 [Rhizobium leguminosarum]|uniref:hypothetical protein n=1 Tax=Rhizobium leguminosarum TaxID=384 RepID=UPI003ECD2743
MNEIQGSSLRWLPTCEEGAANLKEYTEAVGKVVQSSNYLQEKLALLLAAILQTDLTVTLAMWYSTDNDRIQRNFLRAAASAAKSERWNGPPYARKDILWLLHEADTLASMRSLAVNAPCSLYIAGPKEEYLELGPAFFQGHPRLDDQKNKIFGSSIFIEFDYYERFANTLSVFAIEIQSKLLSLESATPWPVRPKLPGRRALEEIRALSPGYERQ